MKPRGAKPRALHVECPFCRAQPGKRCIVSEGVDHVIYRPPHRMRVTAAKRIKEAIHG